MSIICKWGINICVCSCMCICTYAIKHTYIKYCLREADPNGRLPGRTELFLRNLSDSKYHSSRCQAAL